MGDPAKIHYLNKIFITATVTVSITAIITIIEGDIVTFASTSSKNLTKPAAVKGPEVFFFFLDEGISSPS